MKFDLNVTGIIISLILGGLGVIFGKSTNYGYSLLLLGLLIFLVIIIIAIYQRFPSIYLLPDNVKEKVREIYKIASERGGHIYATHIFPKDQDFNNDIPTAELKHITTKNALTYERILILENQDFEEDWIEKIFYELDNKIIITVHVLDRYPLALPRLVKAIIPRINLLLYQSTLNYYTLIGLDRLYIKKDSAINFSILFRSKNIYDTILHYFHNITSYADIVPIKSKEEFKGQREMGKLPSEYHRTINTIIQIAEDHKEIYYLGLFGSLAKLLDGQSKQILSESDFDIDLLIIQSNTENEFSTKDVIKDLIRSKLNNPIYNIIWGDDEEYFYEWRKQNKINIDIEIRSYQSSYYEKNKLLGLSIFRYFQPLYSLQGNPVNKYIHIPNALISTKMRFYLLLNDKKGICQFQEKILTQSNNIDPRRVLSHVLRNLCWADSGNFPASSSSSLKYLEDKWSIFFKQTNFNDISRVIALNHTNIVLEQKDTLAKILLMLEELKNYCHKIIT